MAKAAARQSNATHHLPGRIGSIAGSSAARPVIIGLISFRPRKPIENDRGDVQDDEREHDVEPYFVDVARAVGRVDADQPASGPA